MKRPEIFTQKTLENAMRYALCFLAVILTPLVAAPLAKLLDWVAYGQLRKFITDLITCLFWGGEVIAFYFTEKAIKKKIKKRQAERIDVLEISEKAEALGNFESSEENENYSSEVRTKKKKEKRIKTKADLLPLTTVGVLTAIVVACVLMISAQIGFKVKPFYDIGEKVTGYELLDKIGAIVKNAVKCMWILILLIVSDNLACEILSKVNGLSEKAKTWGRYLFTGVLVLLFGLYDVLAHSNPFALTYLLFYIAFTAIYYLTKKSRAKSVLLILFIYIF